MDVKADENVLNEKREIDIEMVKPIIFTAGSNTYHWVGDKIMDAFTTKELRKG
jgi:hypothetical protein